MDELVAATIGGGSTWHNFFENLMTCNLSIACWRCRPISRQRCSSRRATAQLCAPRFPPAALRATVAAFAMVSVQAVLRVVLALCRPGGRCADVAAGEFI